MLARTNRLHSTRDIGRLRKSGRSLSFPLFSIRFGRNTLTTARATVVVSTKVSKKATARNRVKRQLRAALREYLSKLQPGNDLIIYVKSQAVGVEYKILKDALSFALEKSRLIK